MKITELSIKGAWLAESAIHVDARGSFQEWFKHSTLEESANHHFSVAQANISVSNNDVLRGIHYSLSPLGQDKWVTCLVGHVWDVVVDLRPSSATFRKWVGIDLTPASGKSLFINSGLGHGFISRTANSVVSYLLSSEYDPSYEYEIDPFDQELAITWGSENPKLSDKDRSAPSLEQRQTDGLLPSR